MGLHRNLMGNEIEHYSVEIPRQCSSTLEKNTHILHMLTDQWSIVRRCDHAPAMQLLLDVDFVSFFVFLFVGNAFTNGVCIVCVMVHHRLHPIHFVWISARKQITSHMLTRKMCLVLY